MQDPLKRIADLHTSVEVRSPGRPGATRLMCTCCTRETYPCPTLRIVTRAREDVQ